MMNLPLRLKDAKEEVGRRFKAFRKSENLTLEELGKSLGIQRANVSHWEQGRTNITSDRVYLLARRYGLNPLYILLLSDNMYDKSLKIGHKRRL